MRTTYNFNAGWKFHRGDLEASNYQAIHANRFKRAEWMKAGNHGVARVGYPDNAWQAVELPHDFVIEGDFQPSANAVHGSLPTDVGWYRKTFELPEAVRDKRIHLEFDGIYRDATIWVNGHLAGRHLSGYTSFSLDITELCLRDACNSIAVRCDAREFELWSYEGGGIYRGVRLIATEAVFVPYSGTCVRSHFPQKNDLSVVQLHLSAAIKNTEDHRVSGVLEFTVYTEKETTAIHHSSHKISLQSGSYDSIEHSCELTNPILWSPESPSLYRLETKISIEGQVSDQYSTTFGIRSIEFDTDKGFILNGSPLKLLGVCNHQDHAGVGVAIHPTIDQWRLMQLKEMGCNAIRTAHNPPAPHLLDLCDQMGFLVIDETRLPGTSPELTEQLEALILRDRNHPSVCLWSLGNEEMLIQENATGPKLLKQMQMIAHRLDPTRPCIYSANCDFNQIAENFENEQFHIDVFGANYTMRHDETGQLTAEAERYDEFKAKFPDWPLIASESGGSASTRGLYGQEFYNDQPLHPHPEAIGGDAPVYLNPKRAKMVTAYGETLTPWGRTISDTWKDCATRDFIGGTFLWSGFDYRGETYPFSWPAVVTRYGLMDLCGFPKDSYYYYQAEWTKQPRLHLFPHWNLDLEKGTLVDLWAYTNCDEVELSINGQSFGKKRRSPYGKLEWEVPYEPGKVEAIGYNETGEKRIETSLETSGAAEKVKLFEAHTNVESDGHTIAILNVCACDAVGRIVPTCNKLIQFELLGRGTILGLGNGNPTSHEPEKGSARKLFNGYAQIIIRTDQQDSLRVKAHAQGLESSSLDIASFRQTNVQPSIGATEYDTATSQILNPVNDSL